VTSSGRRGGEEREAAGAERSEAAGKKDGRRSKRARQGAKRVKRPARSSGGAAATAAASNGDAAAPRNHRPHLADVLQGRTRHQLEELYRFWGGSRAGGPAESPEAAH
jgi:hypothetical protein